MATSEQILSLVKSFYLNDENRFKTLVLQIAAHESKIGHIIFANQLKDIVVKSNYNNITRIKIAENSLMTLEHPRVRIEDVIVSEGLMSKILRILKEYNQRDILRRNGFENRRKILLEGPPGTGKTFTASLIASKTNMPLYTIQSDKLVTKYMGETSSKLRQIFDSIMEDRGVYFFDEFDTIGGNRGFDNDVKEMHRVLNSFLQFLEQDRSESIIITATNNSKSLDQALFRRFDDVLHYTMPTKFEIERLLVRKLNGFAEKKLKISEIIDHAEGLCHADIVKACNDAIKKALLDGDTKVANLDLIQMLVERKLIYSLQGE